MRAVLMSIKPEWWKKILAGEKDLEIRKTAPRAGAGGPEPWPLLVLAYVSGTGAVLGQFLCMGVGKKQLLSLFGLPILCAGGGPGEIRRRKIPVWLDRGRGGGIRNAQPAGGVRADPPAHVVAVHRDPGR